MEITERLSQHGASDADIQNFESVIDAKLPTDYRDFLSVWNGGRPAASNFDTAEQGIGSMVHFFYTLDTVAKSYRMIDKYQVYSDRIPPGLVPIACDDFGNQILINLNLDYYGTIYFWGHENENPEGEPYWDNIIKICNSFKDFSDILY
jgi:cell wall assembly regulator SMI1